MGVDDLEDGSHRAVRKCVWIAALLCFGLVAANGCAPRSIVGQMSSPESSATAFVPPYEDGSTRVMKADLTRLEEDIRRSLVQLTWAALEFQVVDRGAMGIPSGTPQAVYVRALQPNDQQVFILVNVLDDGRAEMAVRAGFFGDAAKEADFFKTFESVRSAAVWRRRLRVFRLPLEVFSPPTGP